LFVLFFFLPELSLILIYWFIIFITLQLTHLKCVLSFSNFHLHSIKLSLKQSWFIVSISQWSLFFFLVFLFFNLPNTILKYPSTNARNFNCKIIYILIIRLLLRNCFFWSDIFWIIVRVLASKEAKKVIFCLLELTYPVVISEPYFLYEICIFVVRYFP